ncbi:2OG-Fe(II) oxygenase [Fertoebacter nigrum]|uniref:2OG-Fe(II) oxygenase n=1 Tax=Fertoeibacter niger TaxID=2656921 RepID=A0A8X8GWG5_9RHOB|nr:2OG-Fe(II) oxygenase [Fertoeibacter niger]NUB44397.1 2OG-Fe(II) oxygenase [Fertoeibacter niger]
MSEIVRLSPGDPAPYFTQRSSVNPRYALDTAAGRYLVLCFYHSAAHPAAQRALAAAHARPDIFNDDFACFFGISTDPEDESAARVANRFPGYRHIYDFDLKASRLYGAVPVDPAASARLALWVITDPTLRVIDIVHFTADGSDFARLMARLDALPPPHRFAGMPLQAPILYLPRVFEPEFCKTLMDIYDAQGGEMSGFMRQIDGKTVGLHDKNHKVRRDVNLSDADLIAQTQRRILRRVVPEIAKVHQFQVTRMERYLVACYDAAEGGHFAPHRDNTTLGTAHRRFAVSINLNDDFEGGEVSFPEYGPQGFKAPPGGAVVFSCSLLHKVSRVTAGRRYAFLPFLYDDAAAELRKANLDAVQLAPATDATRG